MAVKQISIFMENRPGRISSVTKLLGDNGIDIRALSLADTTDFGILRIVVNDAAKCMEVLEKGGFSARATNVTAVGLEDRPGGLAKIMQTLYENNISIEYMYSFISRVDGNAYIMLRVDDNDNAESVLEEKGFSLLNAGDLFDDK